MKIEYKFNEYIEDALIVELTQYSTEFLVATTAAEKKDILKIARINGSIIWTMVEHINSGFLWKTVEICENLQKQKTTT